MHKEHEFAQWAFQGQYKSSSVITFDNSIVSLALTIFLNMSTELLWEINATALLTPMIGIKKILDKKAKKSPFFGVTFLDIWNFNKKFSYKFHVY